MFEYVLRYNFFAYRWGNRLITSDVPAKAWPESRGFGLAFDGSGFRNLQAGPEPSIAAGFGLAPAQAVACRSKMHS